MRFLVVIRPTKRTTRSVEGAGPHTHEEHLLVSSLVPRARLFAAMVESLAG